MSIKPRSDAFLTRSFKSLTPSIAIALCQPTPDIALRLWPHLDESVTEETAYHCPMESSPRSNHGEGFAHACPNEFLGVRVQDNVVERLRVAIENRRHHGDGSSW